MEDIDLIEYAQLIRQTVAKWTGIPVSIGIGPTKTLAKIANKVAKTYKGYNGVFNITDHPKTEKILFYRFGGYLGLVANMQKDENRFSKRW